MITKNFLLNLEENLQKTFCVTDIETTGQKPDDSEIIEVASVKVVNGKIQDTFCSFVRPVKAIPAFITKITGIKNDDVLFAPIVDEVLNNWLDFSKNSDYFCAHNVMFDHDFIYQYLKICNLPMNDFKKLKFFCTVKASRVLYPELKSRKLEDLIKHFNIKVENRHRALDDAMATAEILLIAFEDIKKRKKELLLEVQNLQSEKIKTFEAAEFLSVPKEKIYDLIKDKTLKVYETYTTKNGYEGYLFLRKDVEDLAGSLSEF